MTDHDAVRAGDEAETAELLLRLALQAARRGGYPAPSGSSRWIADDGWDLVAEAYDRKGQFVDVAILTTATDRDLELYLLRVFENLLRDRARATERGKLIERLQTILTPLPRFRRRTSPYNAWQLDASADAAWQGDIGHLIRAASRLRGIAATAWNTSGPTPKATRDAIIRVCESALEEAAGYVRDPDVAYVVQTCVPAVPLGAADRERLFPGDDPTAFEGPDAACRTGRELDEPTAEEVAGAIWASLTNDERLAVPHLSSAREVAKALELPRRAAAAVTGSAKAKIRVATTQDIEAAVLAELLERSQALTVEGEVQ